MTIAPSPAAGGNNWNSFHSPPEGFATHFPKSYQMRLEGAFHVGPLVVLRHVLVLIELEEVKRLLKQTAYPVRRDDWPYLDHHSHPCDHTACVPFSRRRTMRRTVLLLAGVLLSVSASGSDSPREYDDTRSVVDPLVGKWWPIQR